MVNVWHVKMVIIIIQMKDYASHVQTKQMITFHIVPVHLNGALINVGVRVTEQMGQHERIVKFVMKGFPDVSEHHSLRVILTKLNSGVMQLVDTIRVATTVCNIARMD